MDTNRPRHFAVSFLLATLGPAACAIPADQGLGTPGSLTGPCIEDACVGAYVCLSELCVDPNDSGPGPAGGSASDEGAASPTTADGSSSSSTGEQSTGPGVDGGGDGSTDGGASVDGDGGSNPTDPSGNDSNTSVGFIDPSGGDPSGNDSNASAGFIDPSGGDPAIECDLWAQDCPFDQKCNPWANDGGNAWNATKCVPLPANPGQVGDFCTVEGSAVSGLDDCDLGAMCWDVDPETNSGTCIGLCQGTADAPTCPVEGAVCTIANDGVLPLCRATCDPLAQDCPGDQGCYPIGEFFACSIDASGDDVGAYADGCDYLNGCDPGLFCAGADGIPGCFDSFCCTEFCALDGANTCDGAGQECAPWYDRGQSPPEFDNVGACALPA